MSEQNRPAELVRWMHSQRGPAFLTIDGPAGAGKTTLARDLAAAAADWITIHLDDIYPGWDGLLPAIEELRAGLVAPIIAGGVGSWSQWSWPRSVVTAVREVPAGSRIILEGCGSTDTISPGSTDANVRQLWVDTPAAVREHRLFERDAKLFVADWPRWESNWNRYIETVQPESRCERVLN